FSWLHYARRFVIRLLDQSRIKRREPPVSLVARTKSTMACLAGPSFHEGKGSAACALKGTASDENTVNAMSLVGFMVLVPFDFDLFGSLGVDQAGGPFSSRPPSLSILSRRSTIGTGGSASS